MYTIKLVEKWEDVEPLWEKWRTYNLSNPEPTIKLKIDKVWIEINDVMDIAKEKIFVFTDGDANLGCVRIQDFSSFHPGPIKMAGISNVAVAQFARNNGIGEMLMGAVEVYLRFNGFDLSLLYSSEYTKKNGFYERLGYTPFRGILMKEHGSRQNPLLTPDSFEALIKNLGKF